MTVAISDGFQSRIHSEARFVPKDKKLYEELRDMRNQNIVQLAFLPVNEIEYDKMLGVTNKTTMVVFFNN